MFNTRQLSQLLREAKKAHTEWEHEHAARALLPADHWPEWYAEWLLPKLTAPTESNNCPYEPVCPKGLNEGDLEAVTNKQLTQLRSKNTRAANVVKQSIHQLLTMPAKWDLRGYPVGPDYVGLPSWWPFWSKVLVDNVRESVRAARKLQVAEQLKENSEL